MQKSRNYFSCEVRKIVMARGKTAIDCLFLPLYIPMYFRLPYLSTN